MSRQVSLFVAGLLSACQAPSETAPAQPGSSSAPVTVGSASPSAEAITEALPSIMIEPKRTANHWRSEDDKACDDGDGAACRRMADRYRGYGHWAGCGLDRGRTVPFRKLAEEDTEPDKRGYIEHIRKACDLGDDEACKLASIAPYTYQRPASTAEAVRVRSSAEGSALMKWHQGINKTMLDQGRESCFKVGVDWSCYQGFHLVARDDEVPNTLTKELADRSLQICKDTLECSDVLMMLDKHGMGPKETVELREEMGSVLAEGCLNGSCTCGEAARYLPREDKRRVDLANLGCRNGEVEGCYELAVALENGDGIEKNEDLAMTLYHAACPPTRARGFSGHPQPGDYSPRACDRLAAYYEGGELPPKRPQAWYYAEAACRRPGVEVDPTPCIRLAKYIAHGPNTGRRVEDIYYTIKGNQGAPIYRKECTRPSIAAQCEEIEKLLAEKGLL